ncbi:MAG: hypothetical protein O9264_03190 [Leptospira sp.]|jgi:hypothetical protein|nr:hypothetical protein [Leptospira sp.]
MPDFDRIDLMNFAIYGNDYDSQWDEVRAYLKSSAAAQRELEEIKRTLPTTSSAGKKRKDAFSLSESDDTNDGDVTPKGATHPSSNHQTKSWWKKIIGD